MSKAPGGLFSQVLRLLAAEGMVSLGTLSLDGTKLAGNAAHKASRTLPQIEKLLAEAAEADAAEDTAQSETEPVTPRALARRPERRPRRPGNGAAAAARATSRAPTAPAPSRGRTSPIRGVRVMRNQKATSPATTGSLPSPASR